MKGRGAVRTEWRPAPPWAAAACRPSAGRAASAVASAESARCLLRLLADKLEAGHWRVACRRYLMLRAGNHRVPEDVGRRCEHLLQRCSARELGRMRADAARWAAAVRLAPGLPQVGTV